MIKMYIALHVKWQLFLSDFHETWIFRQIFENQSNIKFHKSPSSGSRVVPCGRTDSRRDMTKMMVAFRNFAKAPIKEQGIKYNLVAKKQQKKKNQLGRFFSDSNGTSVARCSVISSIFFGFLEKLSDHKYISYCVELLFHTVVMSHSPFIMIRVIQFYSHQLMHFFIQICISPLSYIKIT